MGTTTVRIAAQDKRRLERLQETWGRLAHERPSQQAVLHKALEYIEKHKDQFLDEAAWEPPTKAEWEWMETLIGDYGPTDSSKIDEILYGASHHGRHS